MDLDKPNQWLTLGANVGVVLGILFLIAELNQTAEMNRAQTRNQVASELGQLLRDVGSNPQLAEIIVKADRGDELSGSEGLQYTRHILSMLRYFENVHYQYRQGLYDEGEFSAQREAWRMVFATPESSVRVWCGFRMTFSPEFREEFDGLLSRSCS